TIHSLLAARLDRLGGEERQVIERAAVVGKVFYQSAVSELAPQPLRQDVGSHLMTLVRKELIRPDHSDFVRETAFRFRHMLNRADLSAAVGLISRSADLLPVEDPTRGEVLVVLGESLIDRGEYGRADPVMDQGSPSGR